MAPRDQTDHRVFTVCPVKSDRLVPLALEDRRDLRASRALRDCEVPWGCKGHRDPQDNGDPEGKWVPKELRAKVVPADHRDHRDHRVPRDVSVHGER